MRSGNNFHINVIRGAGGKTGSDKEYVLAEKVSAPIDGVPFDFEVQFIYHATILTHHFAVIRVFPRDVALAR